MVINGYRNPRIITVSGAVNTVYDLSLTNSKGLVETYEIKKLEHELISLSQFNEIEILQLIHGFRVYWTLNYDEFISPDDLIKLKYVFEDAMCGKQIIIVPRVDFPLRAFEVLISSSSFSLGIHKGGEDSAYHRLPVIQFVTKNLEHDLKWFLPGEKQYVTMVNSESIKIVI